MATTSLYIPQGNLFAANDQGNYLKFLVFHSEHPVVYRLFEKFALQLIANGQEKLGAKMIIERIRWEMSTNSKDTAGFKINNNYTCYYSRLFIKNHPQHSEKFEFREIKN